jgi:hypothetical protein
MQLTAKRQSMNEVSAELNQAKTKGSSAVCLDLPPIKNILARIDEYKGYLQNWGTNNEPPVSSISCARARKLVIILAYHYPSTNIHPYLSPDGYIALDLKSTEKVWTIIVGESSFTVVNDCDEESEEYSDEISALNAVT